MTLNSGNTSIEKHSIEDKSLTAVTSNEIKSSEEQLEKTSSEQIETDTSKTSNNEKQFEQNATDQINKSGTDILQHDIIDTEQTPTELSERDKVNTTTEEKNFSKIELSEDDNNDDIIKEDRKRRECCCKCLEDVFECTSWYYESIVNTITSCFKCYSNCCNSCHNGSNGDYDGNYVYNDLNETFNNNINYDADNVAIVEVPTSSTSHECTANNIDDNAGNYNVAIVEAPTSSPSYECEISHGGCDNNGDYGGCDSGGANCSDD